MASVPQTSARLWVAAALTAVIAAVAGCTATDGDAGREVSAGGEASAGGAVSATEVVTGLELPWEMVVVGDSVLVSERDSGRIVEITPDREVREIVTVPDVRFGGEGGLLGLAVDPSGNQVYVYSTAADGNRVQRHRLSGSPGELALGQPIDVIAGLPSAGTHNGGRVAFGPDGKLYVTVGDAGDRQAAQDVDELAGKILRLEPDGAIPADNPFAGSPVYSYGHRNPQGIAWAPDGRMFASEFGQDTWDELNMIEPGGNYGWPVVEGTAGRDGFVDPVQVWAPSAASPSGLAAVGDALYLANLRGQSLRVIPTDDLGSSTVYLDGELGRLRAVALGPDDRLWIATSNRGGRSQPRDGDDRIVSIDPAQVTG